MKNRQKDILEEITDRELIFHLYLTQIILFVISVVLAWLFFDHYSEITALFKWDFKEIVLFGGGAGVLVVLIDSILMKILPQSYYNDGGLNEKIFRGRSVLHIAFISLVVAISEEILFRGVIQTNFGWIVSSVVFALIHFRYLFHWYLFLNIVALSFFIGYIYVITENLFVTIFMHFLIDFLLGVIIKYGKKHE
ncbi:CPBP family intramembrane glutamic endopeptidase [Cytobacillus gottheilii]|uniref:CPBP family intramembrane glutamic endopeptidase n=1 Tax=Cytobacillus gottheilii TaxID=859144 RepID=UPI0009BAF2DE|nr:CPBP family intramembrane glutamic endopeptidase [Cytobacillus gottheilii]